jgi:hypothetical protein
VQPVSSAQQSSSIGKQGMTSLENLDAVASGLDKVLQNIVPQISQRLSIDLVFREHLRILRETNGYKPLTNLSHCPLERRGV